MATYQKMNIKKLIVTYSPLIKFAYTSSIQHHGRPSLRNKVFVRGPRFGRGRITPFAANVVMEEVFNALLAQIRGAKALVLGIQHWVRQHNAIIFNGTLQVAKDQIALAVVIGEMAQALQSIGPFTCSLPPAVGIENFKIQQEWLRQKTLLGLLLNPNFSFADLHHVLELFDLVEGISNFNGLLTQGNIVSKEGAFKGFCPILEDLGNFRLPSPRSDGVRSLEDLSKLSFTNRFGPVRRALSCIVLPCSCGRTLASSEPPTFQLSLGCINQHPKARRTFLLDVQNCLFDVIATEALLT
mmetsp:Transcript_17623/g.36829  ORF Transcript_17623/g.36829 Transcript_17623/m.36829 type:complete len:298 (-) Transcript_17623:815-1708(-)